MLPSCGESDVCNKLLGCGQHRCKESCHDSPCEECTEQCTDRCRCGRRTYSSPCTTRHDLLKEHEESEVGVQVGSSALSPPTVLPVDSVELDELITTMPGLSAGLEGLRMDGRCEGEQLLLSDECDVAPPYVMGSNKSALAAPSEEMTPEDIVGRKQMLYQQRVNNDAERARREQMLAPVGAPQSTGGARGGAASLSAVFGGDSESESEAASDIIRAPREEVKADEPDTEADQPNDSRFITRDLLEEADDESDVSADELAEILEPSTPLTPDILQPKVIHGEKRDWAIEEKLRDCTEEFRREVKQMAVQYGFELDNFQKQAIMHLEKGESVFVAAHTSAGKTVVAEYAIALSIQHLTRAVYTSPIKTLSNQKFREFKKTFGDVGLVTGDVSINPKAGCLILTTEILRSMLYKGADLIRDIEWVIFDEVHYINDSERGVVWEEVIIMLPAHVNIILLSATVPNTMEFADWVGRTKKKRIFVISTLKRPVPLKHYLWLHRDMRFIMDQNKYLPGGYGEAYGVAQEQKRVQKYKKGGFGRASNNWIYMVQYLKKRDLLPVVIFTFSKKKCDRFASALQNMDLTDKAEKSATHGLMAQALERLHGTDKELPQLVKIAALLKNGIGVHHAGLLPIVKEVVEMCFSRGLVKVLFATETFAMGVNMPARTVVFNNLMKHDGVEMRDLLPGEYTQMAGRAGRRGIDQFGTVIINCIRDELKDEFVLKHIITGTPTKLTSRFRLTYNMIMNLLRVEDLKVEDMIKRSFCEFDSQRKMPEQKVMLQKRKARLDTLGQIECIYGTPEAIDEYHSLSSEIQRVNTGLIQELIHSRIGGQLFCPGRVLAIRMPRRTTPALCVLLCCEWVQTSERAKSRQVYTGLHICPADWRMTNAKLSLLARAAEDSDYGHFMCGSSRDCIYVVNEVRAQDIVHMTERVLQVGYVREILVDRNMRAIEYYVEKLHEIRTEFSLPPNSGIPPPTKLETAFDKRDLNTQEKLDYQEQIMQLQSQSKCKQCPLLSEHYALMERRSKIRDQVEHLSFLLSDDNIALISDFEQHVKVLQELKYVSDDRTVLLKGRVACEINTCESLIVTELIFDNVLDDLSPEDTLALLSCLIFQQKSDIEPVLTDGQSAALARMSKIALGLGELQLRCGVLVDPQQYIIDNIKRWMMQVVYEWAKGKPFKEICPLTDIEEGIIVRCITRLDETCKDIKSAARVIGDPNLFKKMEEASAMIKRDIVFSGSLYVM
eukprot:925973_1